MAFPSTQSGFGTLPLQCVGTYDPSTAVAFELTDFWMLQPSRSLFFLGARSFAPTRAPTTSVPTLSPTLFPSKAPTPIPTYSPTTKAVTVVISLPNCGFDSYLEVHDCAESKVYCNDNNGSSLCSQVTFPTLIGNKIEIFVMAKPGQVVNTNAILEVSYQ